MIFLSKPSVYNLPGTWEKQPDVLIPHLHLTPDQGFILFFGSKNGYYDSDDYTGDGCAHDVKR